MFHLLLFIHSLLIFRSLIFTGVRELKVRQIPENIILVGDLSNHGYFMNSIHTVLIKDAEDNLKHMQLYPYDYL